MFILELFKKIKSDEKRAIQVFCYRMGRDSVWKIINFIINEKYMSGQYSVREFSDKLIITDKNELRKDLDFLAFIGVLEPVEYNGVQHYTIGKQSFQHVSMDKEKENSPIIRMGVEVNDTDKLNELITRFSARPRKTNQNSKNKNDKKYYKS